MIYLKHFKTLIDYNNYKNSYEFDVPNVSSCEEDLDFIVYNPHIEKILCKYNVTNTNTPTTLLNSTNNFSSMIVDGIEQEVTNSYTFDTTGKHTVLFTLTEGVTSIGYQAFAGCHELVGVTIGNSVTSIGDSAFNGCYELVGVIISNSVTSIGDDAFIGCSELTSVTIPDSVTSIGNSAFAGCDGLISVSIGNSVTSIGEEAFEDCYRLSNINIPDLVTSIGDHTFNSCYRLTSVIIPDSVTSIGDGAFAWCASLTSINIGNSVTSIGYSAFSGCHGLTSITIPDSVTSIGGYSFSGCYKLTSVTIPDSVISIGDGAFDDCSGLTSVIIPDSVTSIGNYAFNECSSLTSIICNATTAPTILSNTFGDVKTGGTLTVPAGSTGYDVWMGTGNYYLGKYNWNKVEVFEVLQGNKVLCKYNVTDTSSSTKLLNSTNNIGSMIVDGVEQQVVSSYTFNTTGEHTVLFTLPGGVKSINNSAFSNCYELVDVTIGNSVTLIGQQAFYYCSGLTSVTISNSVMSISEAAFNGCSSLTSITIPDSVRSIGEYAFHNCSGLTSIIVDSNNQTYDSRNNCNAIIETSTNKLIFGCKNTIIPNSVTSISSYAFYNYSSLTSINIPNSVTSIGSYAFADCKGLTSVTIGNSVTSIGGYAFSGCSGLTSITCNTITAPTIYNKTFMNIKSGGTLTVPAGSTGYNIWMGTGNYYLGKYNWNKVEESNSSSGGNSGGGSGYEGEGGSSEQVLEENQVLCKYNVTSTSSPTTLLYNNGSGTSTFSSMTIDGVEQSGVVSSYTFNTTGEHTILFTLTEGVTSISNQSFEGCSGLTSVTIPDSVISINERAFYNCSGLTSITIGNSVASIGYGILRYCSGLTSIVVGANNQTYDSRNNCNAIIETSTNKLMVGCKNTIISNSVTSIGNYAFSGSGLTSITIPDSVTSIGDGTFAGCTGLTSITIPDSVTSIDVYAFSDCSGLTSITCNATTAPNIQNTTFHRIKYSGTLTVPIGSTGYNVWIGTGNYYLGKYDWTKIEQ